MNFPIKMVIFHSYVSLPEGIDWWLLIHVDVPFGESWNPLGTIHLWDDFSKYHDLALFLPFGEPASTHRYDYIYIYAYMPYFGCVFCRDPIWKPEMSIPHMLPKKGTRNQ